MKKNELKMITSKIRVRKSELAVMLGVSRQAVSKAFSAPSAPVFGADEKIDAEKALAWYATRGARGARAVTRYREALADGDLSGSPLRPAADVPAIEESRRRQAWADAQLAELNLAKARGEVISRDDAERAAAEDGAAVRADLLALPSRLAPSLADAAVGGGAAAVAAMLDAEIRLLLAGWARTWKIMNAEGRA